jgi:hypothetical protein
LVREGLQDRQCYAQVLSESGKSSRCPNQTISETNMWCVEHAPSCKKKQAIYKIACENVLEAICEDISDRDLESMTLEQVEEMIKIVQSNFQKNSNCYDKVKDFEDECIFQIEDKHMLFYNNVNQEATKCQTLLKNKLDKTRELKQLQIQKEFEQKAKNAAKQEEIERKRLKEEREFLEQEEQKKKMEAKEIEKEIQRLKSKKSKSKPISKEEFPFPEIINPNLKEKELDILYEETLQQLDRINKEMLLELNFMKELGQNSFNPIYKALKGIGIKEFEDQLSFPDFDYFVNVSYNLSIKTCFEISSTFLEYFNIEYLELKDKAIKKTYTELYEYLKNLIDGKCVFKHVPPNSFKNLPNQKKMQILKILQKSINNIYKKFDDIKYQLIEEQLAEYLEKYFMIFYTIVFIFFKKNYSSSYVIKLLNFHPFTIDKVKDTIRKEMSSFTENNNLDQILFDRIFTVPVFKSPIESGKLKSGFTPENEEESILPKYQNILQITNDDNIDERLYKYYYAFDVYKSYLEYIAKSLKEFYMSVKRLEIIYSKITSTQKNNACQKYNLALLDFLDVEVEIDKIKTAIKDAYKCEVNVNKNYISILEKDKEIIDMVDIKDVFDKNVNMDISKQGKISRQAYDILFEPTLFLLPSEFTPTYTLPYRG